MIIKCKYCKKDNIYLKCLMCLTKFYADNANDEPMCKECFQECEDIYIETINKKKQLALEKAKKIQQIKNLPKKYQNFLIDFDGD